MEEIIDTFNLSENLPAWSLCYRFVESRSPRVSLMLTLPNQDKTNNVIDLYKDILRAVEDLTTCSYTSEAFSELLDKIQGAVSNSMLLLSYYGSNGGIIIGQIDRLNLEGYANLDYWVAELDKRIEGILLQRLTQIIQVWCTEFDRADDSDTRRDLPPIRDLANKRRGDKRAKEEKVSFIPTKTPSIFAFLT